jgi:Secretion system C-terminal sorting domain
VVTTPLGCTATDTIVISMFAPLVSYVETQTVACINNGTITLTPGLPAGGTYSGPGVTGTTFDPVVAGLGNKNIVYSWADSTGCTGRDTSVITVSTCAGLADINGTTIKAFPNPGDGMFRIESGVIADLMTVTDIAGREVLQLIPSATSTLIDLRKQETGVYTLLVHYRGEEATMKLVIAR